MKAYIFVTQLLVCLLLTLQSCAACAQARPTYDIVFVLDGSYSTRGHFGDIKEWTRNLAARFDIESGIYQIGVIQYSSLQRGKDLNNQMYITTEVKLGQHKDNSALATAISGIVRRGLATYTAHAINKTILDFKNGLRWSDCANQKVMIVVTDGLATDSNQLAVTAKYARSLGIIPFAVGVGQYDIQELREIATGNQSSNVRVFTVKNFIALDSIVSVLSGSISDLSSEEGGVVATTQQQSITVTERITATSSSVESTAPNTRPQTCTQATPTYDIIFVLDGSYSTKYNFDDIKKWTENMASRFDIESGIYQIGVVQYSSLQRRNDLNNQDYIKTEIKLGQHKDNSALATAISRIVRRGLSTYTAHAINKTILDFKNSPRWSDCANQKVMIVVTDGDATDSIQLAATAEYARSLGIIPFAVGVGQYDIQELREIATGNQSSNVRVFTVQNFIALGSIVSVLSGSISDLLSEDRPEVQSQFDVVFVLDGSYSVANEFGNIKRWTQHMAARFDIERGFNQIGVVQYSSLQMRRPLSDQLFIRTEVRLGQHTTNAALNVSIERIVRRGLLTYTAHAINKTVLDFKKSPRWLDVEVTKVMIVLTDGKATDTFYLATSAQYARSLGIVTFAIGVGNYDIHELRIIATGDQYSDSRVFTMKSFRELQSIVNELHAMILRLGEGS